MSWGSTAGWVDRDPPPPLLHCRWFQAPKAKLRVWEGTSSPKDARPPKNKAPEPGWHGPASPPQQREVSGWGLTRVLPAEIVDQPGVDIFGQVYNQWKNKECVCPNCSRSIAASRFAPHLEKCLGMGRNSSRIANRR